MNILNADAITRVEVPENDRTDDRDAAAEYIEEMWGPDVTMTDIAEESGYSRQHIRNTLDQYFKPAGDPDLPDDEKKGYKQGYREGYRDGWQDRDELR